MKTGTKEWAKETKNLFIGCRHDCRYCYARENALRRGYIESPVKWSEMRLSGVGKKLLACRKTKIAQKPRRIMFPSTHDLFPEHLDTILAALCVLLEAGNEVLIVTKPHLDVIKTLCHELESYKKQIIFRFTIGSTENDTLSFWEPGAPSYDERFGSLRAAYNSGYKTSVSCEPYFDGHIYHLILFVLPYVTDSVWIGKLNKISSRVDTHGWTDREKSFLTSLKEVQKDEFIKDLYLSLQRYCQHIKDVRTYSIRWKDSCKRVLGLPEEEIW